MSSVAIQPIVTSLDRFGLTLCLAIILHALIILGITFAPEDLFQPRYETMEIILVTQSDAKAPDEADFLSQANLEGGGDSEEKVSPSTQMPAPFPEDTAEQTAAPMTEEIPPQPPTPPAPEETLVENEKPIAPTEVEELLVTETEVADLALDNEIKEAQPTDNPPTQAETNDTEEPTETIKKTPPKPRPIPKRKTPSAASLLTNSFKIASLSAEIRRKMESKAQRPKRKFISASTKEFKFASYMEAWRSKVERVGNLNYPDEAMRNKLSGSLILDVALNQDGSLNEIVIRKSSGHTVLDDAAIRIVELAAPYLAFPDSFRDETDILHITRTWRFANNKGFR